VRHRRYAARVELSAKVVDRLERLELTLAHELCHAACWVLNHTAKPPHGQVCCLLVEAEMHQYRSHCVGQILVWRRD
jgi:SprT-like family